MSIDNNHNNNKQHIKNAFEFFIVPKEIDTHFQLYGKHMWDVKYEDICPICDKRIDEFGFCTCNSCPG